MYPLTYTNYFIVALSNSGIKLGPKIKDRVVYYFMHQMLIQKIFSAG